MIATGISAGSRREVPASQVGDLESKAVWTKFPRGLRERGLAGVQLVIPDHTAVCSTPQSRVTPVVGVADVRAEVGEYLSSHLTR